MIGPAGAPPEWNGEVVERIAELPGEAVVFRAHASAQRELDALIDDIARSGSVAADGVEIDLGWDRVRFEDRDGVLVATTKDGRSTRPRVRVDDVTQLLWVRAEWERVAHAAGIDEIVPSHWRDSLLMTVDVLKGDGPLECRRIDVGAETQWFIGARPFDDALVERLRGDIAYCVELFARRPEAVAALGLPVGYSAVVEHGRGVVEVRDPQGAIVRITA
ncbi:hypothetical protein [Microbacterium sp. NPDC055683]